MGFCGKHNDVECSFFCNTCRILFCHMCMEKGDHEISKHDCIPVTQYWETKSNEIRSVLEEATKHKIRYDEINSKWDMHFSSDLREFDKIKIEIALTKQRLLQQLEHDEQLQLKAAGTEKAKLEKAMKFAQCSLSQNFFGIYDQLNGKCQSLLRNPSSYNSEDNAAVFEECRKLSNNLNQVLSKYEKEDMLGINLTFVPSNTCSLGKLVVPNDASCFTESRLELSNPTVSDEPTRKRKKTDSDIIEASIKKEKLEKSEGEDDPSISKLSKASTSITNAKQTSQDGTTESAPATEAKRSNQDGSINLAQSNKNGNIKSTVRIDAQQPNRGDGTAFPSSKHIRLSTDARRQLSSTSNSLQAQSRSLSVNKGSVPNSRQHITVNTCCSGIVWADTNWLFEVTTTKASIKVRHHKLSDGSLFRSDTIINCKQTMEDEEIRVCPKIYSPNSSFVLAFKDHIAIISLQDMKLRDVSWHRVPNTFSILAIAWRRDPSNYVAIVKGPDGTMSLIRDVSESSASPKFEQKALSNIAFSDYHPLDISPNDDFAVCNTNTGMILFFSNWEEYVPKRHVVEPSFLTDGKPLSISFVDDTKEWLALWKGNSASDGLPKWVIIRYNSSFIPVSTILQCSYRKLHEEPKAFCVRGNKIAVLYNSLKIRVHTLQSIPS